MPGNDDEPIENGTPFAGDDFYSGFEDNAIYGNVLGNDGDPDGDVLTAALTSAPAFGSVDFFDDGSFTYYPPQDFDSSDSFTYEVSDGRGGYATATVTIQLSAINDPPYAEPDYAGVMEDGGPVEIFVTLNDYDPTEGDAIFLTGVTQAFNGTVTLGPNGGAVYTPNPDFYGFDSFSYIITDSAGSSSFGEVTVEVYAVNDAPDAIDDAFTAIAGVALFGNVLANDTDIDVEQLFAGVLDGPKHGTLTLSDDGSFVYTPDAGFGGVDSFVYQVNDSGPAFDQGVVTITVAPPEPGIRVRGTSGSDVIDVAGSDARHLVSGRGGDDQIRAGGGNDLLQGDGGKDRINGGAGDDIIVGGRGADRLSGGAGEDVFAFARGDLPDGPALDLIRDFEGAGAAGGDLLRLQGFGPGATLTVVAQSASDPWQRVYAATDGSGTALLVVRSEAALAVGDYVFG